MMAGITRRPFGVAALVVLLLAGASTWTVKAADGDALPPAPTPEPVALQKLPLPPSPDAGGTCRSASGCITDAGQAGGFLPDNRTVSAMFTYAGAPAAPDPASVYSGSQIVLVKSDGTTFPDGTPWKCVTCGVPPANRAGAASLSGEPYPQPFRDGRRILAMTNIVECSPYPLDSEDCTPDRVQIYRINRSGMRELRLHPDNEHLGFNEQPSPPFESAGVGRLELNTAAHRYELLDVVHFVGPGVTSPWVKVDQSDPSGTTLKVEGFGFMGEFRGWTGDGKAALGMCWAESNNTDICATDLKTGKATRLTADPSYVDPVAVSPDSQWTVALETRYQNRYYYLAGLRGLPPINELNAGAAGATVSGYRIGQFRLFQPYLLDRHPERLGYDGQQLNACQPPETKSTPNSFCDPNWGTRADPRWSNDGTKVVFGQTEAAAPNCLGYPPLGCPDYTEVNGNTFRIIVATLSSREPKPPVPLADLAFDGDVPWGTPDSEFVAPIDGGAATLITSPFLAPGVYTLPGKVSGKATVTVGHTEGALSTVYDNYSEDGVNFYNGSESVTGSIGAATWHSALVLTDKDGRVRGGRFTSPGGYTTSVMNAFTGYHASVGLMTTVIDGNVYLPPNTPSR